MKKYFVINDKQEFLWEDGKFYPAFEKIANAVDEDVAKHYEELGCKIEYAEPEKWPRFYDEVMEVKKPRRTYIRVTGFTLAAALDELYDDKNTYNIMLSMEDGDFLISFEYRRDYERPARGTAQCCDCKVSEGE